MSASFPLPPECLQLIIRYFLNDFDSNSPASLLRVNKEVFFTTVPILYENPFRLRQLRSGGINANADIFDSLFNLTRTLLLSLPHGKVTDLLRAAYLGDEDQQSFVSSSVPYYSFITTIDFRLYRPKPQH